MRRLFIVLFITFLMVGGGEDILAKGSRGGKSSFRSSGSKSSGSIFKTAKSKPKPAVAPKKTRTDQKSTIKKSTNTQKPKAASQNKMDRRQTKVMKSKNKVAAKKYGNKANATKTYKTDMAKKHTSYKSATPPSTRPASIPQTVVINNGPSMAIGYHPFGGGYYGYGYMDPVTNMYVRLAAAQMIANDMALQSAGYGHYGANGAPIVYRNNWAVVHPLGSCVQ